MENKRPPLKFGSNVKKDSSDRVNKIFNYQKPTQNRDREMSTEKFNKIAGLNIVYDKNNINNNLVGNSNKYSNSNNPDSTISLNSNHIISPSQNSYSNNYNKYKLINSNKTSEANILNTANENSYSNPILKGLREEVANLRMVSINKYLNIFFINTQKIIK